MPALTHKDLQNRDASPAEKFGVYIHWPFCLSKCPYCDFNSHLMQEMDENAFADALCTELDYVRQLTGRRTVTSIFFGGGTPSLMAARTVDRVLSHLARLWSVSGTAEITLEANPTSTEMTRFRSCRASGVNRVSLGIQALRDKDLRFLGRLHSVREALAALDLARSVFPRTSFDLIYARPGQGVREWEAELQEAMTYAGGHLSLYQLTIEPDTPFQKLYEKGALIPPTQDRSADLYELTQDICNQHGLPAYEVSNHARPGEECRHNLGYWRYDDYAGVGPGAHGRLTVGGKKIATETRRLPAEWLACVARTGHGFVSREEIAPPLQATEMMLTGLRLGEGVSLSRFEKNSKRKLCPEKIRYFVEDGLLEVQGDYLRASARGRLLLNTILSNLLETDYAEPFPDIGDTRPAAKKV